MFHGYKFIFPVVFLLSFVLSIGLHDANCLLYVPLDTKNHNIHFNYQINAEEKKKQLFCTHSKLSSCSYLALLKHARNRHSSRSRQYKIWWMVWIYCWMYYFIINSHVIFIAHAYFWCKMQCIQTSYCKWKLILWTKRWKCFTSYDFICIPCHEIRVESVCLPINCFGGFRLTRFIFTNKPRENVIISSFYAGYRSKDKKKLKR